MDQDPLHIIKLQILEVSSVKEKDAQFIQQETKRIFQEKILPLLDDYCTKLSPNGTIYRIDKLELDVGKLRIEHLEEEILKAVQKKLHDYFHPLLLAQEKNQINEESSIKPVLERKQALDSHQIKPGTSQLELLQFFVQYGSLPWWVDTSDSHVLKNSLDYLLIHEKEALVKKLQIWVKKPDSLKRLLRAFRFPAWTKLATLSLDIPAELLTKMLADLIKLMSLVNPKSSQNRREEELGINLLSWMYVQDFPVKNTPAFWEGFFIQWATSQKTSFDQLITDLFEKVKKDQHTDQQFSSVIIEHINRIWEEKTEATSSPRQRDLLAYINSILKLTSLTDEERISFKQAQKNLSPKELEKLEKLEEKELRKVLEIVEKWEQAFNVDEKFLQQIDILLKQKSLSDAFNTHLVQFRIKLFGETLEPEILRQIQQFVKNEIADLKLKEDLLLGIAKLLSKLPLPQELKLELQNTSDPLPKKSLSSEDSGELESGQSLPDPALSLENFSEGEELFVANAGLVILWPFLQHFFGNRGLLSEGNFVDESAAHRATGLLQFLADGQVQPAEYHCGLNKILCGLSWDALLDFSEPVTKLESEESERFLQSLIAHAPILGEMSIEGFRGSFLLRKGMLKAELGHWQLFVEGETYDVVLDKFPWNWKMVKLPWMQGGIEVTWG